MCDSFFANDLTTQYLDKLYEDLHKEQMKLMTEMKNVSENDEKRKEKEIQKQLSFLNTLMINTLRLRNLKKSITKRVTGI
jgi:predicted aldo/keto reductase-like oxidoreductase